MSSTESDLDTLKRQIREQAHENRRAQPDKDEVSAAIVRRFMELPEYAASGTVMFYLDVRAEVRTRHALPDALQSGKRIVVPYCVDGELELFHLTDVSELSVGMYKILEPREDLRSLPEKRVDVSELDLIMVPGVAFDRQGAEPGMERATTISYLSMLVPRRRSSPWLLSVRSSRRFRCSRTTFSWTRS